jgi:hypothetical protein
MNFASTILGCVLVIHGGYNGEEKRVLQDFALYDIESAGWVKA